MTGQQEFVFSPEPSPVEIGEVELLLNYLSNNPGFHTAKQITSALDLSDRKIRQLAEASDGLIVSGPGSPGYCHLYHCDPRKLAHIADTLRSQARAMLARSIRIRKRAHQLIR